MPIAEGCKPSSGSSMIIVAGGTGCRSAVARHIKRIEPSENDTAASDNQMLFAATTNSLSAFRQGLYIQVEIIKNGMTSRIASTIRCICAVAIFPNLIDMRNIRAIESQSFIILNYLIMSHCLLLG